MQRCFCLCVSLGYSGYGFCGVGAEEELVLPRAPYSVAEVVAYLYAARMGEEFGGLSVLGGRERDRAVQRWGKRVGLRWVVGRDGHARVSVDVKELEGD